MIVAAVLGLVVATSFWLAYFDFFPIRARQLLADRSGAERTALARDIYTYLHLPMVAGIVLFAFAMETTLAHVGDELDTIPALGLCGGPALYLFAYVALRLRVSRTLGRGRLIAALACALLWPIALVVPALVALALVAAVWVALHAYEIIWWRDARGRRRAAALRRRHPAALCPDMEQPLLDGRGQISAEWHPSEACREALLILSTADGACWWTNCTAMAPSPTAVAQRLVDPERTSPAAKTPGTLVSSRPSASAAGPVRMNPRRSRATASPSHSVHGSAPRKRKRNENGRRSPSVSVTASSSPVVAVQGRDLAAVADRDAVALELPDQVVRTSSRARSARRCSNVTSAPPRASQTAAWPAELPPPTTPTRWTRRRAAPRAGRPRRRR